MTRLRILFALMAVAIGLSLGGTATAQESDACAAYAEQQVALDAYEAEIDAAFAGYYASVDALDVQLPKEFDAQLDAYRAYLATSRLMIEAQISTAQASIDAGLDANDC